MDPGNQPAVLVVLTQVEEMLICRASPILQVTHAHISENQLPKTFPILPNTCRD